MKYATGIYRINEENGSVCHGQGSRAAAGLGLDDLQATERTDIPPSRMIKRTRERLNHFDRPAELRELTSSPPNWMRWTSLLYSSSVNLAPARCDNSGMMVTPAHDRGHYLSSGGRTPIVTSDTIQPCYGTFEAH